MEGGGISFVEPNRKYSKSPPASVKAGAVYSDGESPTAAGDAKAAE